MLWTAISGLLIDEATLGKGLGNIVIQFLFKAVLDRGCKMLEWGYLDWNAPTIDFY